MSENILEYHQKSEIVFICIFVIKNDLNMIKITGRLYVCPVVQDNQSLEKMAKRKVKMYL